ncbi:MAG: hypothetical protein MI757_16590 [Pirellulales bacterium]|nr:hypothetical protein [Pirellulales bacterium]
MDAFVCRMMLVAVAGTCLATTIGCSSDNEANDPVAQETDQQEETKPDSQAKESKASDSDTETKANGSSEIDISEFLPEASGGTPEAASLTDLKFKLVAYTEKDGEVVRTKGSRKEYTNGEVRRHGKHTHYYTNGKPQSSGDYEDDRREGPWTFWHPNGQESKKGNYSAGLATGKWTAWYPDGKVQSEGAYDRSKQVGVWTFYAADGEPTTRDFSAKDDDAN